MTPIHERLKAAGAVFEARFGWERASWYSANGAAESPTFRRNESFACVAAECHAVRQRVGLLDLSSLSKFEISGSGAAAFLDRLCANQQAKRIGGIVLAPMLAENGRIKCEGAVARLTADQFYMTTATVAELHDRDWLERHCPANGVRIDDVTLRDGVLVLAGPRARDVLSTLTPTDLSIRAFPWLTVQEIEVGNVPVRALRCNYVGEAGWELHHAFVYQTRLYDVLIEAGREHGLAHFGTRAMNSLRLEKAHPAWGADLSFDFNPIEAGLERLLKLNGRDFVGRKALEAAQRSPSKWRLAILSVDAGDADASTNAPVFVDGEYAGIVTSGGYGHTVDTSIALAYLTPPHDRPGSRVEIEILGDRRPALVVERPLYDPDNLRQRA